MQLYLFRHGEAEPARESGDDARELTAKGRDDVRRTAEALARAGAKPDAIVASPLVRARQTAEIAGRVLGAAWQTDARLRPGATLGPVQALLAAGQWQRIMLVGHEPDLSSIIGQLTGGRVKMRAGGVARVDAERIEPRAGVLLLLTSPDMFPAT
jgi:phosphohistidine phosphatase